MTKFPLTLTIKSADNRFNLDSTHQKKEMEKLKELGFEFECSLMWDDNIFIPFDFKKIFNNADELIAFIDKIEEEVVLDLDRGSLLIYNDSIE